MKKLILVVATTLLVVSPSLADEDVRVRYQDLSGRMSLTMSQDIGVPDHPSIASRDFSFGLALTAGRDAAAVTVTIDQAKATYVAHNMEQRLGTRHLTGRSFPLSIADQGKRLELVESSDASTFDLGPPVVVGYSVAGMLTDALPLLPEATVAVGATWTTEREVRSLEGWAWGAGRLVSRHRVTAVERQGDHTVVTVVTEAEGSLIPIHGGRGYTGELKRTLSWTFDATDGRLLSMSMEQETDGVSSMAQGETQIHQLTRMELVPRS